MAKFQVNPKADTNGTSLQGYFNCSYKVLEAIFGEPVKSDEYKVSTEWVFEDVETGDVYTLYDWKETNLYSPNYPSVDEFRSLKSYEWHIGGYDDPSDLINFLNKKVEEYNQKQY